MSDTQSQVNDLNTQLQAIKTELTSGLAFIESEINQPAPDFSAIKQTVADLKTLADSVPQAPASSGTGG